MRADCRLPLGPRLAAAPSAQQRLAPGGCSFSVLSSIPLIVTSVLTLAVPEPSDYPGEGTRTSGRIFVF